AKIVQIDIDRAEVNKNVIVDHHVIGDAAQVLSLLCDKLQPMNHASWKEYVFSFPTDDDYGDVGDAFTPKAIADVVKRLCPKDAMVTTDVGQHQMWAAQLLHFHYPGQLITSGGFGAMGFGLGAAIGAKVGNPEKTVIHITGDGSFRMNSNELATEEHYNLPIVTILFDNRALGMVRQWQSLICHGRYSQTSLDRGPDFVKLAEAYGLEGRRVDNVRQFEEALSEALSTGRGFVIDCIIDQDEKVKPMVAGGDDITSFLLA
ncbi:MAG: acetolactate synthase large subunit, partial [Eggerthellaceae bacterium]|nr:acetolactate synthase large subunit [Eggerthellaceae bacterium]